MDKTTWYMHCFQGTGCYWCMGGDLYSGDRSPPIPLCSGTRVCGWLLCNHAWNHRNCIHCNVYHCAFLYVSCINPSDRKKGGSTFVTEPTDLTNTLNECKCNALTKSEVTKKSNSKISSFPSWGVCNQFALEARVRPAVWVGAREARLAIARGAVAGRYACGICTAWSSPGVQGTRIPTLVTKYLAADSSSISPNVVEKVEKAC